MFTEFFWDFDGTLFDTYPRMTRAILRSLQECGVAAEYDWALRHMKRSLATAAEAVEQRFGIASKEMIAAYRRHAEDEGLETILPYSGAGEILRAVVSAGGRNYLYTHRNETALHALERHGMLEYFCDAVTANDGFPSKPAPNALEYLIGKHDLNKAACVMIGDRPIDLDAGKNAGIEGVLFDPESFYPDYPVKMRFFDLKTMQMEML